MIVFFWTCLFLLFYTFIGYGILLYLMVVIKRVTVKKRKQYYVFDQLPSATIIIAAYNEENIIQQKIENTFGLFYPKEKLSYLIVTDGSSDNTPAIVRNFPEITLLHSNERKGKINAVHRAMTQTTSEIVIFTDANTFLNKDALTNIARHYKDINVGAVAGEKRVRIEKNSDATSGEGYYWKYESTLKKWDSELYTVVGAAGELFSIRSALYQPVQPDTILDDFLISMNIAVKGYRIVYEPKAFAVESSSANIKEEMKRKVRIAAGGIQSILRLKKLLNIFRFPVLSFQYISHRVLRWTITPFLMIVVFILNIYIVINTHIILYLLLLAAQIIFYGAAFSGWILDKKEIKNKFLFIPYYFCFMNFAILLGIKRYFLGNQKAAWDKATRKHN